MENKMSRVLVALGIGVTLAITLIRCLTMRSLQDAERNRFEISVISIILFGVLLVVTIIATVGKGKNIPRFANVNGTYRRIFSFAGMICGIVIFITIALDLYRLIFYNESPPPNKLVQSSLDGALLIATIIFGFLAGVFLLWFGLSSVTGVLLKNTNLAVTALFPALWMWFRLVRYEVSYQSTIRVTESFYDFVMLIFSLLFLFSFARYLSGIGEKPPRSLFVYSIGSFVLSISGTITRLVMYLTDYSEAYRSSQLAGVADFFIGAFALCVALALATKPLKALVDADEVDDEADVDDVVVVEMETE